MRRGQYPGSNHYNAASARGGLQPAAKSKPMSVPTTRSHTQAPPPPSHPFHRQAITAPATTTSSPRKRKHPSTVDSGSAAAAAAAGVKVQRLSKVSSFDDEGSDDELDLLGTAALEDYELTQRARSASPVVRIPVPIPGNSNSIPGNSVPDPHHAPIPGSAVQRSQISTSQSIAGERRAQVRVSETPLHSLRSQSSSSSYMSQPTGTSHSTTVGNGSGGGGGCGQLDKRLHALQEENYSKDGEVKVLRSEKEKLTAELRRREEQMRQQQSAMVAEREARERQLARERDGLHTRLQFKDQEVLALQEKCAQLERKVQQSAAAAALGSGTAGASQNRSLSPSGAGSGAVAATTSRNQPQKTSPNSKRSAVGKGQCDSSSGGGGGGTKPTSSHVSGNSSSSSNSGLASKQRSRSISPCSLELKKLKRKSVSDKGSSTTPAAGVVPVRQRGGGGGGEPMDLGSPGAGLGDDRTAFRDLDSAPLRLTVPGRELDGSQILLLLVKQNVLRQPVAVTTPYQLKPATIAATTTTPAEQQSVSLFTSSSSSPPPPFLPALSSEKPSRQGTHPEDERMTGLLSLLQIEPKAPLPSFLPAPHSTPISERYKTSKTFQFSDSESHSSSSPPPPMTTPTRSGGGGGSRQPFPHKPHTLARMNLAQLRAGKQLSTRGNSGLLSSSSSSSSSAPRRPHSTANTPLLSRRPPAGPALLPPPGHSGSSLLSSITASSLQKNIGNLLMSAEMRRFASYRQDRGKGSLLSLLSADMGPSSSAPPSSSHGAGGGGISGETREVTDILKVLGDVLVKYHREQADRSKVSLNSSISAGSSSLWSSSEAGNSSESLDASLYFSPKSASSVSSPSSSKTSLDLQGSSSSSSPLPADQRLVGRVLESLEVLVTYSKVARTHVLQQPPEFSIDSCSSVSPVLMQRVPPSLNVSLEGMVGGGGGGGGGKVGGVRGEEGGGEREGNVTCDLVEVSNRLTSLPGRRGVEEGGGQSVSHRAEWKSLSLSQVKTSPLLSDDVWTQHRRDKRGSSPFLATTSEAYPSLRPEASRCGHLLPILLDLPSPPWKESATNILSSVRILATLAEDCPTDSLHRFGQLLQKETLIICLEREEPPLTDWVVHLLTHLVRSEDVMKGLCLHSDPCILHTCYKCLLAPPPSARKEEAQQIQLHILELLSHISLSASAPQVLYESCSCSHELLSSVVSLLEKMVEGVDLPGCLPQRQLSLLRLAVSLVFRISVSDQYFDTHRDQCEHAYAFVFNRLTVLAKSPGLADITGMVGELLSYCEDLEDSEHESS